MKNMKMKLGDLVRNRSSESGLLGVIVGWNRKAPVVSWADGRVNWVMPEKVVLVETV
tara:strand:- start:97 stop:267 length:171 start_codon:yes stop_codon:yes gene_type:complete